MLPVKYCVDWITTRQGKNVTNTKMVYFENKNQQMNKKHIFSHMTTFSGFTLKIETSWARNVLKPILEMWNANEVIVYIWFIYSRIK